MQFEERFELITALSEDKDLDADKVKELVFARTLLSPKITEQELMRYLLGCEPETYTLFRQWFKKDSHERERSALRHFVPGASTKAQSHI